VFVHKYPKSLQLNAQWHIELRKSHGINLPIFTLFLHAKPKRLTRFVLKCVYSARVFEVGWEKFFQTGHKI